LLKVPGLYQLCLNKAGKSPASGGAAWEWLLHGWKFMLCDAAPNEYHLMLSCR
jgi:hypothetical protein